MRKNAWYLYAQVLCRCQGWNIKANKDGIFVVAPTGLPQCRGKLCCWFCGFNLKTSVTFNWFSEGSRHVLLTCNTPDSQSVSRTLEQMVGFKIRPCLCGWSRSVGWRCRCLFIASKLIKVSRWNGKLQLDFLGHCFWCPALPVAVRDWTVNSSFV